jgi:hypothetical protein
MSSRPRTVTLRLTEAQRGSMRAAMAMQATDAAENRDHHEVRRLDKLVEMLDAAWVAARPPKSRWYARKEKPRPSAAP